VSAGGLDSKEWDLVCAINGQRILWFYFKKGELFGGVFHFFVCSLKNQIAKIAIGTPIIVRHFHIVASSDALLSSRVWNFPLLS
jgi:hypothetical protein